MQHQRRRFTEAEGDIAERHLTAQRRHRDVGGFSIGLLGGAVDHIPHHLELQGALLEFLPGLHHLNHRPGDVATDDAEGE